MSEFAPYSCCCGAIQGQGHKYTCPARHAPVGGYMRVDSIFAHDDSARWAPTTSADEHRYFDQRPLTTHQLHEYHDATTCMTSGPLDIASQSGHAPLFYSNYGTAVDDAVYQQATTPFVGESSSYGLRYIPRALPSIGEYTGPTSLSVPKTDSSSNLGIRSQSFIPSYATPSFMEPHAMQQTPRMLMASTLPSSAPVDGAAAFGPSDGPEYTARNTRPLSLPFNEFCSIKTMKCEGQTIVPEIHAQIVKNVFFHDNTWTCYRRNYISVECSYSLEPSADNARIYLESDDKGHLVQVQALAVSLHASVDTKDGKPIELVQHTPKRDRGPQYAMRIEKLSPAPRGHPISGYSTGAAPAPHLPHQLDEAAQDANIAPPNPKQTQHTFERVQFKQATANNGRRRAQQQYYHLMVALHADVREANSYEPKWVKVAQQVSPTMVVRGRSPGHYSSEDSRATGGRGPGGSGRGGSRRESSHSSYPHSDGHTSNAAPGSSSSYPNNPMGASGTSYHGYGQYKYGQISPVSTLPTSSSSASRRRSLSNASRHSPAHEDVVPLPNVWHTSVLPDTHLARGDIARDEYVRDSEAYSPRFSSEVVGSSSSPTWNYGNVNRFKCEDVGQGCYQSPGQDSDSECSYGNFSSRL